MSEVKDVITAKAFQLVDGEGRKRASLFTSEDGSPNLEFYDKEGDARIAINVNKYGKSVLLFWAKDALPLIEISIEPSDTYESPKLKFLDGDGSAQARLTLGEKPALILKKDGEFIFQSHKVVKKGDSVKIDSPTE